METRAKPAPKEKRRNNEKRKEKSRDAARCRRSRETEIFTDLGNALPLDKEQISQLDKASVMRLAISYLRVRDMINLVPELPSPKKDNVSVDESVFLKSLEGFLLVLSPEGDLVYLSENVSDYLGITQIDLMGQNIYEYTHPCDHEEIKEIVTSRASDEQNNNVPKSFFIRMKCTLTSKGRSVNLKSATYKVIHCIGHTLNEKVVQLDGDYGKASLQKCFVAIGQPIPHPSNIEAPLGRNTFLSKHSLDMKFTYVDDIMVQFLGYEPDDLLGESLYKYHHAMDSDAVFCAFKCLFSKGQCETRRYRFLAKTGGFVWVLTQATLINDKMQKPQSVVCVNYIISGIECEDEIYSSVQRAVVKEEATIVVSTEEEASAASGAAAAAVVVVHEEEEARVAQPQTVTAKIFALPPVVVTTTPPPPPPVAVQVRPQTATSKLFAPRTEDMNKGFLTFSEEEPGLTMLKDEPEDLTHLAPVAGDVCVPLDDHPFLTDMLEDFLLKDNFAPLLNDEPADPFISYRDSCDPSPQLLSPNLSKSSESSLASLNSPGGSLEDEDHMSTFMPLGIDDDDSELNMKAPYIPMSMGDDLPLLMPDDVIWNAATNLEKAASKNPDINSNLAQLLCTSKQKSGDHGGGIMQNNVAVLTDVFEKNAANWNLNVKSPQSCNRADRKCTSNNKRSGSAIFDTASKRLKHEPKEKMSSELLQQLMSSNTQRGRPKGKSNWLLDSGQKAACVSQPSDSVLMNLLDDPMIGLPPPKSHVRLEDLQRNPMKGSAIKSADARVPFMPANLLRKNSFSLLDPEGATIASLLDLTQQDFEVNAPVNNMLQGEDLLIALEMNVN